KDAASAEAARREPGQEMGRLPRALRPAKEFAASRPRKGRPRSTARSTTPLARISIDVSESLVQEGRWSSRARDGELARLEIDHHATACQCIASEYAVDGPERGRPPQGSGQQFAEPYPLATHVQDGTRVCRHLDTRR